MEYSINCYADVFRSVDDYQSVDKLGKDKEWDKLIEYLEEYGSISLINSSAMVSRNEPPPSLFTPLHYAAQGKAPKHIFESLLKMGASRCIKTKEGETSYDIGKRVGLDQDIVELLRIPAKVEQNQTSINKMEQALHGVINGRVDDLIKKYGQQLPQIAILFESDKDSFFYPVPEMYGGFKVFKDGDGIRADSWIRICGGSEENHQIDKDGKVTLLPNDNPM